MTKIQEKIAEERRGVIEGSLIRLMKGAKFQRKLRPNEIFHALKSMESLENVGDINQAIVVNFLDDLVEKEEIVRHNDGSFQWNHFRGRCHTIIDGKCSCCGHDADEDYIFADPCPICREVNPIPVKQPA